MFLLETQKVQKICQLLTLHTNNLYNILFCILPFCTWPNHAIWPYITLAMHLDIHVVVVVVAVEIFY